MNSALIEFEDGVRHIVSRFAIKKALLEPSRCACPECLVLDSRYPNDGFQLALL